MTKVVSTGPGANLHLQFRIGRVGNFVLTFLNSDGDAYDISADTWQLNIKTSSKATPNLLQLTAGAGLTIVTNVISGQITEVQSALTERIYYYELYNASTKKTWLAGRAYFFSGEKPFSDSAATITVSLAGTPVTISIAGSGGGVDGGTL